MIRDYPAWHVADNHKNDEKNCLTFDRLNHDVPVLVPDTCYHRKPFICMRPGEKFANSSRSRQGKRDSLCSLETIVNRRDICCRVHRYIRNNFYYGTTFNQLFSLKVM